MEAGWPGKRAGSFVEMEFTLVLYVKRAVSASGPARLYLPVISYHIISYHIISYHIISYHIISYHIISYHIISYHIISYPIISYLSMVAHSTKLVYKGPCI